MSPYEVYNELILKRNYFWSPRREPTPMYVWDFEILNKKYPDKLYAEIWIQTDYDYDPEEDYECNEIEFKYKVSYINRLKKGEPKYYPGTIRMYIVETCYKEYMLDDKYEED